jgi:osmotically-inducible protein OsmY
MRKRLNDLALGAALGSLAGFFLDPDRGRRRRALIRDRARALARRASSRAERAGGAVGARVYGMSQQALHLREQPKDYDDVTLTRKVETELFRPANVPKGQIDVNVQKGVVQLRGEVPRPDLIDELVDKARRIQGVREVENLLHLPNAKAPMHQ